MTNINHIGTVFIPVSDQDKALHFYTNILGFEKRMDATYSDGKRWVEVAPVTSKINFALVDTSEGIVMVDDKVHCAIGTTDIEADYKYLKSQGVEIVDRAIGQPGNTRKGLLSVNIDITDPLPKQFSFRDPDGNRFLIVQP